jgi:hypothetical protein
MKQGASLPAPDYMRFMTPALSDDEQRALVDLLRRTIAEDRYPLSPRILKLKAILAKFRSRVDRGDKASLAREALRAAACRAGAAALNALPRRFVRDAFARRGELECRVEVGVAGVGIIASEDVSAAVILTQVAD